MGARVELGRAGEEAALEAYRRRGYALLARNWRCPLGELDLVLVREGLVVVCEVKTRAGSGFGGGHEAVTPAKRERIRRLAEAFLRGREPEPAAVRFDVASVRRTRAGLSVELFEDAF
ncbi:hypothetical protein HRbin12_01490 [bacterium HR12]|nr:hypothetical protein HRbin12_01490 [bacterium HR12]